MMMLNKEKKLDKDMLKMIGLMNKGNKIFKIKERGDDILWIT